MFSVLFSEIFTCVQAMSIDNSVGQSVDRRVWVSLEASKPDLHKAVLKLSLIFVGNIQYMVNRVTA